MALGGDPVFDPDRGATAWITPTRDITRRVDTWDVCFEILTDDSRRRP